ncbi:hypothetical protein Daura_32355 [Dactylosporangium aurantiacum]|uniref:Lipoprotein n=1 Tax=Dactylosporangium aurantiacum TaxID=35754 RepID=A0A9Q9MCX1_9ACTN|nr:hypothetical protein [Dactylosporangium aurantiacum]MDG6107133.1 hypothetical protein [Dactylosporangium aurantiacum]UWZ51429.1 hypothetical protein Daura_32355 [Dactylosporangium aurantiacum]
MRRVAAAVVAATTLTSAGCTLSTAPHPTTGVEGVMKAFQAWTRALAGGKGGRACAMMIDTAARDFTALLGAASCPEAVTALHGQLTADQRKALATAEIDRAKVDFDSDDAAQFWYSDVRTGKGPFVLLPGRDWNVTVFCWCDDTWKVQYPAEHRQRPTVSP